MVELGLAESRTQAQAMILAGQVLAAGQRIDKAGHLVDVTAEIRIKGLPRRFVSRGGMKLEAALEEFAIDPAGKTCIDIGASTGGFTDCLLQRGAARVWAIDVGHNQMVWRLRQDPRVIVHEGINARSLSPEMFPVLFDLATVDVSFISLKLIFPSVVNIINESADVIALIKPQFEVGKGEVGPGGIVREAVKHIQVIREVYDNALQTGLMMTGLTASPILGAEGNREFLARFSKAVPISFDLEMAIRKVIPD